MKNKEKYLDEILKSFTNYSNCDFKKRLMLCGYSCEHCKKNVRQWLEDEYQEEPIKLTDDEIVILKNIDKKFDWIDRDEDNVLTVCTKKLPNGVTYWETEHAHEYLAPFSHLFQFIKKYEPYNIDELLKQNGVERR